MKHTAPLQAAGETIVKVPTRRTLAKQQTRAKVLAAARRLFSEEGYEGATIRDIASAAGMSTGAVFANFTDKSDLFREIMMVDMVALGESMREAAGRGKGVDDALLRMFGAGYAFYKSQLPLARAAFSVGWAPEEGPQLLNSEPSQSLLELIAEQLNLGIERGELGQEAEVKLRAQMLFEAYLSNYKQAIFEGWSLEALQARSRDQIRVILAGARRG
ncbi:MAG: transcriptional regulator, TetR famil [Phenylobacterium sp.]|jgi:AcrR family transcriptional regulator|nr:transcriptional regulator, TetR famil [Phenylobacterium sp.]